MLKTRIIPTLLYKNYSLVKSIGFDNWRNIGTALPAIKVYNTRQVDELIFLDINVTQEERTIDFELIDQLADDCFMPLTVGGGIKHIEDIRKLLCAGADKVAINSAAISYPQLISQASHMFGSQCIVASIDVRKNTTYEVFSDAGKTATGKDPILWAKELEKLGVGEILLTSIERDGTMEGYDIELIQNVSNAVNIPVIASGGAGNYNHLYEAIECGKASAAAAASMFHFTQQTPMEAKLYLKNRGIPVRI